MTQPNNSHLISQMKDKPNDGLALIGLYRLILGCLLLAILGTGVAISIQTQKRHETYKTLQSLKKDLSKMQIEEQRLLIEQQTFSATPQVARRAVSELGMFFPGKDNQKVVPMYRMDKNESNTP